MEYAALDTHSTGATSGNLSVSVHMSGDVNESAAVYGSEKKGLSAAASVIDFFANTFLNNRSSFLNAIYVPDIDMSVNLSEPSFNPILIYKSPVYVAVPNVHTFESLALLASNTHRSPSATVPGSGLPG